MSARRSTPAPLQPTPEDERLSIFAVCAPGLEALLLAELREIGIRPGELDVEPGGVAFKGSAEALYSANLHLRTASRILVRLGEFRCRALGELERHAKEQRWEQFIPPNRRVRLRVTCRKSRLYHTGAVGERIAAALEASAGTAAVIAPQASDDDSDEGDEQLVVVRLLHDRCTISIDASGTLLHRRGYRQATAKAPLRETLAAAILLASGWDTASPLLDPMCGAGTIAIEAALLARRIAPGALGRSFAFMQWPGYDSTLWERLLGEARARVLPGAPAPIQGSDRDAGAMEAAVANAERAGVAGDIRLTRRALSGVEPPPGPGWLITNPPYGARVGERDQLRNLYAQLGNVARARCPGWTVVLLSADPRLERQLELRLTPIFQTRNGGIAVRAVKAVAPRRPWPL